MTGPEHYREAERLTNHAVTIFDGNDRQHAFALWEIQQAQVHATLALAAATALASDQPVHDHDAWRVAAATKAQS